MVLCGCASRGNLPASLNVALPTQPCEQILQKVALPAVKPSDDARLAFVQEEAALIGANARIGAGRDCIAKVRMRYGGAPAGRRR